MAKKTIILTQKQLDEVLGADSSYLDGLGLNPDTSDNHATEITADGTVEKGYPKKMTGDDMDNFATNNWPGNARFHGMGPGKISEMTKKEFESLVTESPNQRLLARRFGESQRTIGAATQAKSVMKKAKLQAASNDPATREKGLNTLRNMDTSGIKELELAQNIDRNIQSAKPEGEKIASAPKDKGNGKAHTPKDGIIY